MIKITENISLSDNGENFIVEHTDENENTTICYTDNKRDSKKLTIGILEQLLLTRAWFVCSNPQVFENLPCKSPDSLENTLISDLHDAIVFLGGEKYHNNGIHSGCLNKIFHFSIEGKEYVCESNIEWYFEEYEDDFPNFYFSPKFKWWLKENENLSGRKNRPSFKKSVDFDEISPSSWKTILNNRNLNQFIIDMIKNYNY